MHVGTARGVTWSIDHIVHIQAWITLSDVVIHEVHEAHVGAARCVTWSIDHIICVM